MPCEHVLAPRARDQHDELARDVDAVDEYDVMDLARVRGKRPEPPEPLRAALEGRLRAGGRLLYRLLAHEPLEERLELLCRVVDVMRGGRPAALAPPSLGA